MHRQKRYIRQWPNPHHHYNTIYKYYSFTHGPAAAGVTFNPLQTNVHTFKDFSQKYMPSFSNFLSNSPSDYSQFILFINVAIHYSTPRSRKPSQNQSNAGTPNSSPIWRTPHCTRLLKDTRKTFRKWRHSLNPDDYILYQRCNATVRRAEEYWKRFFQRIFFLLISVDIIKIRHLLKRLLQEGGNSYGFCLGFDSYGYSRRWICWQSR